MSNEEKYCAFIDVLGYKNFILSSEKSIAEKLTFLSDIFKVHSLIAFEIKGVNLINNNSIFVKSFSDCIYFESSDFFILITTMHKVFNAYSNFYQNFDSTKHRSLIRGGLVKDWTEHFMDTASLSRNNIDDVIRDKQGNYNYEFYNPVGPGIARAYLTSEKSNISGMRLIISPECLNNIELSIYNKVNFECYTINHSSLANHGDKQLFLLPVLQTESGYKQFELCWPANFIYDHPHPELVIEEIANNLSKMKDNCKSGGEKHFTATVDLLKKGVEINLSLPSFSDHYNNLLTLKHKLDTEEFKF